MKELLVVRAGNGLLINEREVLLTDEVVLHTWTRLVGLSLKLLTQVGSLPPGLSDHFGSQRVLLWARLLKGKA